VQHAHVQILINQNHNLLNKSMNKDHYTPLDIANDELDAANDLIDAENLAKSKLNGDPK
jgi:hypothetical protein